MSNLTVSEKKVFLLENGIPTKDLTEQQIEAAYEKASPKSSEIYNKYKSGKLTASGNSESLSSGTMFTKFGVQSADELFDLLENKEIKVNLLSIGEVKGTELPKNVLGSNKASEVTGIRYRLECSVSLGETSDKNVVFNINNKGSLLNKFGSHLLDATFGVVGGVCTAKIAKYEIDGRVILGLIP